MQWCFCFVNRSLIGQISVSGRLVRIILPLKYLFTKANQSWSFVTRHLIGLLHSINFLPRFHLEADSIFALAFADKMTKKLNCHQETTGTQGFLCPKTVCLLHHYLNSHFPWLTSRAAAENSSKKQYPTHFHLSASSSRLNNNLLNKKPANQSGRTYHPKW